MRANLGTTVATYALLSLTGVTSFLLPDEIDAGDPAEPVAVPATAIGRSPGHPDSMRTKKAGVDQVVAPETSDAPQAIAIPVSFPIALNVRG